MFNVDQKADYLGSIFHGQEKSQKVPETTIKYQKESEIQSNILKNYTDFLKDLISSCNHEPEIVANYSLYLDNMFKITLLFEDREEFARKGDESSLKILKQIDLEIPKLQQQSEDILNQISEMQRRGFPVEDCLKVSEAKFILNRPSEYEKIGDMIKRVPSIQHFAKNVQMNELQRAAFEKMKTPKSSVPRSSRMRVVPNQTQQRPQMRQQPQTQQRPQMRQQPQTQQRPQMRQQSRTQQRPQMRQQPQTQQPRQNTVRMLPNSDIVINQTPVNQESNTPIDQEAISIIENASVQPQKDKSNVVPIIVGTGLLAAVGFGIYTYFGDKK